MILIKEKIRGLKRKYMSLDPFEISKNMGIKIIFEDLGSIKGYYNKILRQKQIHINQRLSEHEALFTCAHELGHALMHPDANTPFLRENTMLSIDKMEIEANKFAMELLLTDENITETRDLTVEQMSYFYGYHINLILLRLK